MCGPHHPSSHPVSFCTHPQIVSPDGVRHDSQDHYMNVPAQLIKQNPEKYFDIDQYDNLKNPEGHYKTLGPEIWQQTQGKVRSEQKNTWVQCTPHRTPQHQRRGLTCGVLYGGVT